MCPTNMIAIGCKVVEEWAFVAGMRSLVIFFIMILQAEMAEIFMFA